MTRELDDDKRGMGYIRDVSPLLSRVQAGAEHAHPHIAVARSMKHLFQISACGKRVDWEFAAGKNGAIPARPRHVRRNGNASRRRAKRAQPYIPPGKPATPARVTESSASRPTGPGRNRARSKRAPARRAPPWPGHSRMATPAGPVGPAPAAASMSRRRPP